MNKMIFFTTLTILLLLCSFPLYGETPLSENYELRIHTFSSGADLGDSPTSATYHIQGSVMGIITGEKVESSNYYLLPGFYLGDMSLPALFQITPNEWDFGLQAIGSASPIRDFTISNEGERIITITPEDISIIVLEGSSSEFILYNIEEPVNLRSGESVIIGVQLTPLTEGVKSAHLRIQDNLRGGAELRVSRIEDQNRVSTTRTLNEISLSGTAVNALYSFPFSENFDSVTMPALPAGWTIENTNGDSYYWVTNTSYPYSAPNSLYCRWNTTLPADDWVFTPPLLLRAGKSYEVSFRYRAYNSYYPENLKVHVGTAPNSSSMTEGMIFDHQNFTHTTYQQGLGSFNITEDGVYHLGWHKYSAANQWAVLVDDILITELAPMEYISSTTTQNNTLSTIPGAINQEMLGIAVQTAGFTAPLTINGFAFTTDGTTDVSDIANAKVWYTGTSPAFAVTNQVGTTIENPEGEFQVNFDQALLQGWNYFWLTYDLPETAVSGHFLDATCETIIINGEEYIPAVTNPAGFRRIGDAMSGVYTINANGTGDFLDFNEAVSSLILLGVSGPVIIEVSPGTYTEQVLFEGTITGASETNNIKFTGLEGTRTKPVLRFAPTVSDNRYVVRFSNTGFLSMENLIIESIDTASQGFAVHIMSNCHNIRISNCQISVYDSSWDINYIPLVISGSPNNYGTIGASNVSNILLDGNTVTGGFTGISVCGAGVSDTLLGMVITNNTILNSHSYGIGVYNATTPIIKWNNIVIRSSGVTSLESAGIRLYNLLNGSIVANNLIINAGKYGIYCLSVSGSEISPNQFYNNMIGGGFRNALSYGVYIASPSSFFNIYFNSVNVDTGIGTCLYVPSGITNLRVLNNNFAYTGNESSVAAFYAFTSSLIEHDYNNYYSGMSPYLVYYGTNINTLSELQAINVPEGNDQNSITGNPFFVSITDIHSHTALLWQKGIPIPGIDDDYDLEARDPLNPCIGADEFTPLTDDLAALTISGETIISVGEDFTYNVILQNTGSEIQDYYLIKLMQEGSRTILASILYTEAIAPAETICVPITWEPQTEGTYNVFGKVELAGDLQTENDQTINSLFINVFPAGTNIVRIGNADTYAETLPLNFFWKNSVSQTIYMADELNLPAGAEITTIAYFNNFFNDLSNKAVKLWIGETAISSYSGSTSWIQASALTPVFDGNIHFPSGKNTIFINFTEPYVYNGGNIVLMANRVWEDNYYSSSDRFSYTATSYSNRSLNVQHDSTIYDPYNMTSSGSLSNRVPNTVFLYLADVITELEPPLVSAEIIAGHIFLSWDVIDGANSYLIYSSDDPYAVDWGEPVAIVGIPFYNEETLLKRFYRIVASTEAPPVIRMNTTRTSDRGLE